MKALTNILTHTLLMLLLLMLATCTEETAEVDNLSRQEQYVSVRMNIPGMTAATTRAEEETKEDNITSITALAYDSDDKLTKIVSATNLDTEKQTFNITVPNGTRNIHFLANNTVALPKVGTNVSALTSLTTSDYNNLCYWGKTTYDGSNSNLTTTLYRNLAKISIMPSETDTEFNQFEQEELIIAGLINPNRVGKLVPYNTSFPQNIGELTYNTLPDNPDPLNRTPIGNNGDGYGSSLYVFEHENSNYEEYGLFVICKIGDYFYNVALTSDGVTPYTIIRNHEYIIYVSDVDDYQTDEYRSMSYSDMYDINTNEIKKKPINLEVKKVAQATFSNTDDKYIDWNNGNPNGFDVAMGNITEGTVTLTIDADGFMVTQGGNELSKDSDGNYSYTGGNANFTFTPTAIGQHTITISGTGTYASVPTTTINVNVTASITANATTSTTLYYDSDDAQTVTVQVTVPAGVETLNIGGAENFTIAKTAGDGTLNGTTYTMGSERTATFTFTLNAQNVTNQQVFTFSGDNVTADSVIINMVQTPTVAFSPDETSKTMNVNDTYNVTMNGTLTALSIAAEGFTVTSSSGGLSGPTNNVYTYAGGTTTFTFTPTSAGDYTIRFYDGQGENINVPDKKIAVTVNAAITATAKPSTIYYDGDDKTTTVSVTIPKGVSALNISAPNFEYGEETDGSYIYTRTDDATTETTVQLTFTLIDGVTNNSTIEFSATNVTSAIVNITVTNTPVVEGVIVIWESAEQNGTSIDWNRSTCRIPYQNFVERIPSLKIGDIITINYIGEGNSPSIQVEYGDSESQGTQVQIKGNGNNDNIINCDSGESSYSFEVNSDNMVEMLKKYDMVFIGSGASILSITVTPASTTE